MENVKEEFVFISSAIRGNGCNYSVSSLNAYNGYCNNCNNCNNYNGIGIGIL
jgi:hypothetical protein